MTMQMSEAQIDSINKLAADGWKITNHYPNDGTWRMAKRYADGGEGCNQFIGVFIRRDGSLGLPHTHETQVMQAILHDLGFKFKHGRELPEPPEWLQGVPPEHMEDDDRDSYIAWLEETLIPDLRESGFDGTADDFETCVRIIRELVLQRDEARRQEALNGDPS